MAGDSEPRNGESAAPDAGRETVAAEGATVGEAKWAAMKELERRYPGLDVEHVTFELLEERPAGEDPGFARVSAHGEPPRLGGGGAGIRVAR